MLDKIDHIGIVAHSFDEAREVFVDRLGLTVDESRTKLPDGNLFKPQNTRIYFLRVAAAETRVEVLIPQDDISGVARYLAKSGPGLHHICYGVRDMEGEIKRLRAAGVGQIDLGPSHDPARQPAAFFYPKDVNGILTELIPWRP